MEDHRPHDAEIPDVGLVLLYRAVAVIVLIHNNSVTFTYYLMILLFDVHLLFDDYNVSYELKSFNIECEQFLINFE